MKNILNSEVPNHMAKSNDNAHQKRMDNNCHIPDLVQAFSNVKNIKFLVYSIITFKSSIMFHQERLS